MAAWVLNLDADLELAARGPYAPRRSIRESLTAHARRLAETLLRPDDVIVDETTPPLSARDLPGHAFCPTPRAIALLERAGARPVPHPPVDVLRRVNAREFAARFGIALPGARFMTGESDAVAMLSTAPPVGTAWRVKRQHGMAGRGQRIVEAGALSDAEIGFVRAGMREGGVQIEPNVVIVREYALHGMIDSGSEKARFGRLVTQECDAVGAWVASSRVDDEAIVDGLMPVAERVAVALARERYTGPFGIDAFTFRSEAGVALHPLSEINARYAMGFPIGFGRYG